MEVKPKIPKTQRKWQDKYDAEKMRTIGLKVPIAERTIIEQTAEKSGLKLATFCRACIRYCIDNNIDLSANQEIDLDKAP